MNTFDRLKLTKYLPVFATFEINFPPNYAQIPWREIFFFANTVDLERKEKEDYSCLSTTEVYHLNQVNKASDFKKKTGRSIQSRIESKISEN